MESAMRKNIKLLYVIRALRSMLFAIPIIVPFFQENGLSQTQIFVLQAAFAIGVLLIEVPSGYFADRYGRKNSMLIGAIVGTLAFAFYTQAHGFWPILVAEMILGVGLSFMSGTDSALAYDSLAAIDQKSEYRRFESRGSAFSSAAEASAAIAGGMLALISLRTTIYAQVAVEMLLVIVVLFLTEPPRIKTISENPIKDVLRVTKYAVHDHKGIKWIILYSAAIATLTHTMVWLTQPYYQLVSVPIGWFGALWAAQMLSLGVFAQFADRYESTLGKKRALVSLLLVGVVAYILLGLLPYIWMLPAILAFYFIRGVQMPILRDYINSMVESDVRATVLSVKSLVQKLIYTFLGPLIGVVMDVYSLQTALLFSAVVYGVFGGVVLLNMKRLKQI